LIHCDQNGLSARQASSKTELSADTAAALRETKAAVCLLLAEDNAVNQKVALRQLTTLGFQAHAVSNGLEAVQAIEREVYPIVLMDCQMPEMDGYKATECIRLMQDTSPVRWKHRPYIIAMTANALAGDREACLAAGMDDYLSKPVRLQDLREALQRGVEAMQQNFIPHTNGHADVNGRHDEPLLNLEALENLRDLRMEGEPDPLKELVELFVNDTPSRIAQLQVAVKIGSAQDLEAAAHSLKGSAGNLGASTIEATCLRLMQLARANDFTASDSLVKSIETDFAKLKPLLLDEMKK
jgi:CheY-like chemotaxis protein/HPt (histidine-containing phosphotransfer) domain-containing protein